MLSRLFWRRSSNRRDLDSFWRIPSPKSWWLWFFHFSCFCRFSLTKATTLRVMQACRSYSFSGGVAAIWISRQTCQQTFVTKITRTGWPKKVGMICCALTLLSLDYQTGRSSKKNYCGFTFLAGSAREWWLRLSPFLMQTARATSGKLITAALAFRSTWTNASCEYPKWS